MTADSLPPVLATVGVIAERLGVPLHRVEYIIRSRSIAPTGRAGGARVFDDEAIARIEAVLSERLSSRPHAGSEVRHA